jgi:chloramphenicol-sensitive protein RarD
LFSRFVGLWQGQLLGFPPTDHPYPAHVEHRRGIWYGVAAYVLWGLSPIFWNLIEGVPAIEVLAHRVVWSIPVLIAAVAVRGRWPQLKAAASNRATVVVAVIAGTLLSINWGVFIWAVTSGRIVESSLGYFINPLVSVALGVIVLREHLRPAQRVAVLIAAVGVVVMTLLAGVVPWVALVLAFSFGFYGLLKKRREAAPPIEGLLGESVVAALPLTVLLVVLAGGGEGAFGRSEVTTALLVASGLVTVVPLLLFGAAAQRIPLSMVGILQYLAPTIQLVIGITIYDETVSGPELVGFAMVWIALAVYTIDSLHNQWRPMAIAGPGGS